MRRSTILWFLIATCLGVALFLVKHEVQQREEQLASLHREILASQEAIHVLEAEWSYLNRPDRLEALVRRHLNLVPLDTQRLGSVEMLPMRLPMLQGGVDGLVQPVDLLAPLLAGLPPLPVARPVTLTREARR